MREKSYLIFGKIYIKKTKRPFDLILIQQKYKDNFHNQIKAWVELKRKSKTKQKKY